MTWFCASSSIVFIRCIVAFSVESGDRIARPVGGAVHRDGADRLARDEQRPAHRRVRRPLACLVAAKRQAGLGGVPVDENRLPGGDDVAEDAAAAWQRAADETGRKVRPRGQLELVL